MEHNSGPTLFNQFNLHSPYTPKEYDPQQVSLTLRGLGPPLTTSYLDPATQREVLRGGSRVHSSISLSCGRSPNSSHPDKHTYTSPRFRVLNHFASSSSSMGKPTPTLLSTYLPNTYTPPLLLLYPEEVIMKFSIQKYSFLH